MIRNPAPDAATEAPPVARKPDSRRCRRWVAVFDNHGDKIDPRARRTFEEFVAFWKPHIRIHGGDCWDFRFLRKRASDEESREDIRADLHAGADFLQWYRPDHFLRGNHDERLWNLARDTDDGKLRSWCGMMFDYIRDTLGGATMLPYDKRAGVLRLGHLKVVHGYTAGVYAARTAATAYGSVIQGHTHTIDHYSIPGLERRVGRCVGCLCQLDLGYNRAHVQTLRQAHGWAYGFLFPTGDYTVFQAEEVSGRWIFPSEFRTVWSRGLGAPAEPLWPAV